MPFSLSTKSLISFIVSLALFMEAVDSTIINTAIPSMAHSLQVNPIDLKIALISYLLSLAIFIPVSGWVADKFGAKRVFIIAIAIFTLSSLWCGFAHSLPELVIARAVQGFGSSLSAPVGRLIIVRTFQRHELIRAMSRIIMIVSIGPMLGPALGGFITHHYSWPWIFWVNVPIGIFAILLSWRRLAEQPPRVVHPLDKWGFVLFGICLASLTFGLSALSESTLSFTVSMASILLAAVTFGLYMWHSQQQPHPFINTELFKLRTFRVSTLSGLIGRTCFGGVPFLLPLLLQIALGYSPQTAGLLLAPIAFGLIITKTIAPRLLQKFGFKRVLIINTLLISLSLCSFILINKQTSIYFIGFLTLVYGLLISLQFSSMNPIAYAELPDEILNSATSIMGTNQQLSQSFGVALCALLLRHFSEKFAAGALNTVVFKYTFLTIGILTALSILVFFQLKATDGHELTDEVS